MQDVARGIGLDNRIGAKFLHAGPGYGGSCFPKDTLALIKTAQDHGAPVRIVETVAAVNEQRKRAMGRKVVAACGGAVRGKTVAVLGPDLQAEHRRHARGARARRDRRPAGRRRHGPGLRPGGHGAGQGACSPTSPTRRTPMAAPRAPTPSSSSPNGTSSGPSTSTRLKAALRQPVVVDLRNIYRPDEMARHGFTYVSVGRRPQRPDDRP